MTSKSQECLNRGDIWVLHVDWLYFSRWTLAKAVEATFILVPHPAGKSYPCPKLLTPAEILSLTTPVLKPSILKSSRNGLMNGGNSSSSSSNGQMVVGNGIITNITNDSIVYHNDGDGMALDANNSQGGSKKRVRLLLPDDSIMNGSVGGNTIDYPHSSSVGGVEANTSMDMSIDDNATTTVLTNGSSVDDTPSLLRDTSSFIPFLDSTSTSLDFLPVKNNQVSASTVGKISVISTTTNDESDSDSDNSSMADFESLVLSRKM